MKSLIRNSLAIGYFFLCVSCSSTSLYKIVINEKGNQEVQVSADRVLLECEDIDAEDLEAYGFFIHVLDDANTVLSVWETFKLDKKTCYSQMANVAKILNQGDLVRIYGKGDLEKPRKKSVHKYKFTKHGTFYGNERNYSLVYIKNNKGGCFDPHMEPDLCGKGDL